MAWDRLLELSVGRDGYGLLISDLDMDFRIDRSLTLSENTAEFTIFNAKQTTRNEILRQGNNIIFKAGYKDESIGTLFIGNIIEAVSYKEGSDWKSKIKAICGRSNDQSVEVIPISLSYSPGTLLSKPLNDIAAALGLVINGSINAAFPMANGWTHAGTSTGALRYIEKVLNSKGANMFIDNNELVIYREGDTSRFRVVMLSYSGGLFWVQDITKPNESVKRIEFESLIIPALQVNGPITIKTSKLEGTFITERLVFTGNNYGGDFKMRGEAAA